MNIDELTLGQCKELQAVFGSTTPKTRTPEDLGVRIAVLQRGWVYIGRATRCGDYVTLKNAACIRYWGTTRGLGELAEEGPTDKTKLDSSPDVHYHVLTEVMSIECVETAWEDHL